MEDLLVKVFIVIDKSLSKNLQEIRDLIQKNNSSFETLKADKMRLQQNVMDLYCSHTTNISLGDQISFLFKMAKTEISSDSVHKLDITRVIDQTHSALSVGRVAASAN